MASWLGDLVVRLKTETADFQQDMGKAAHISEQALNKIQRAAAVLGASLSAGGLVLLIKHSIDAADRLNDLSKATAVSAVDLGGLGYAASQSGSSLEGIAKAFGKLNVHVADAKSGNAEMLAVFRNLGISLKDLNQLTSQQMFGRIADVFSAAEDSANKAAYGNKLFGKSYMDIMPTLDEGGAKILQNIAYYKQYSGVTEDLVRKSDEFNDQLEKLRLLSGALGMTIARDLIGPMKGLVDELVRVREKSDSAATSAKVILEVFKAVAVVGLETKFTFETIGKDMARAAENMKLIATGDFAGSRNLGRMFAEDAARARKDSDAMIARIMVLGTNPPALAFGPIMEEVQPGAISSKRALPNLPMGGDKLLALQKRQIAAVQAMEEKRKSLFGTTEEQLMLERLSGVELEISAGKMVKLQGTYEDFEAPFKRWLMDRAKENDARKQLIERIEAEYGARRILIERVQQDDALRQQAHQQMKLQNEEMLFGIDLLGRSAREQEKLNLIRQVGLATKQRIRDRAGLLPQDPMMGAVDKIVAEEERLGEAQKRISLDLLQVRQDAERSWAVGASTAMASYADSATNAALQAQMAFQNSFKGMEDALVQLVKTGKLDFKSLADSIVTDLIRIQIQRNVMAPLVGTADNPGILSRGLGEILRGAFSFGGSGSMSSGEFGAAALAGLPGYASGTGNIEYDQLAVLHKDEAVIPAAQNAGRGSIAPVVNVTFHIQTPDVGGFRASRTQIAADMMTALGTAARRGG